MILIGEASLYRAASQFVLHYHAERNHQGFESKIIRPEFTVFPHEGEVSVANDSEACFVTITVKPHESEVV